MMVRLPRIIPLSRLKGARPARAAASPRLSSPSSGIWAKSKTAVRSPTPVIVVSFCALRERSIDSADEFFNEQIELIDLLLHLQGKLVA